MTGTQVAYLVILALCIMGSGFFSGSETALIGVPRERVAQLVETDRRAVRLAALTADPDRMPRWVPRAFVLFFAMAVGLYVHCGQRDLGLLYEVLGHASTQIYHTRLPGFLNDHRRLGNVLYHVDRRSGAALCRSHSQLDPYR